MILCADWDPLTLDPAFLLPKSAWAAKHDHNLNGVLQKFER